MLLLYALLFFASPILCFGETVNFGKLVKEMIRDELEDRFVNLEEMAKVGSLRSDADGNDIGDILRGIKKNEDRVAKLEEMARIGTLRSCAEYSDYGLMKSGLYEVDPDGSLNGQEPFQVYCNFTTGSTEVLHNTEKLTVIDKCHEPGCYQKAISYMDGQTMQPIALSQMESLIQLSEHCEQTFKYFCFSAPLSVRGINYAFWENRHGEKNVYFTGSNYDSHVCDCHYEPWGCIQDEIENDMKNNTCNCDANRPNLESDSGTITNSSALPITKLYFGGINTENQDGSYMLGRFKCFGKKPIETGTSCSALKRKGIFKSGYYNIKPIGEIRPSVVFCDMTSDTYTDVPQIESQIGIGDILRGIKKNEDKVAKLEEITDEKWTLCRTDIEKSMSTFQSQIEVLSGISPIGTILAWVPKPQVNSKSVDLPDGWMLCDGREITKGPWTGGKTPDLNSVGAFLRGGKEDLVLEMEDHQMEDHEHTDSGHSHSCTASSTAGSHFHSYTHAVHSDSDGKVCGTDGGGVCADKDHIDQNTENTASSSVSVTTTCQTKSASSGIGKVSSASKKGSETRPINMKVMYVIRII